MKLRSHPAFAALSLSCLALSSCVSDPKHGPVSTKAAMPRGAEPINVEDLCGIMGLRLTKFNFPVVPNLNIIFRIENGDDRRQNQNEKLFAGGGSSPFMIGYRNIAPGSGTMTLIGGFQPESYGEWQIPNPRSDHFRMRDFDATPLPLGRTVLMVWSNEGGKGWRIDERNFVQRLVIELKVSTP